MFQSPSKANIQTLPDPINFKVVTQKNMAENFNNPSDSLKQPLKFNDLSPNSDTYRRKLSEGISNNLLQVKHTSDPQLPDRYELLVRALTDL